MSPTVDPFAATPDPALYISRRASERAVVEFERGLFQTLESLVILVGPPGIGKSTVLHQVARRLESRCTCIIVEYAELPLPELCKWVLREIESQQSPGNAGLSGSTLDRLRAWRLRGTQRDPESALVQSAAELERTGRPLVVLIDGADDMDARTASGLGRLAARAQGSLFVGLATCDDQLAARAGRRTVEVAFAEPMSAEETAGYISARLERTSARSELRANLDRDAVARLHSYSEGNPRRLHGEIALIQIALDREREETDIDARLAVTHMTPAIPEHRSTLSSSTEPPPQSARVAPVPEPIVSEPAPVAPSQPVVAEPPPAPREPTPTLQPAPAPSPAPAPMAAKTISLAPPVEPRPAPMQFEPIEFEEEEPSRGRSWQVIVVIVAIVAGMGGWWVGTSFESDTPDAEPTVAAAEIAEEPEVDPEPQTTTVISDRPTADTTVTIEEEPAVVEGPGWTTVSISADPNSWAEVWIDGKSYGFTPLTERIQVGPHKFRVKRSDGKELERTLEVGQENRNINPFRW